MQQKEYAAAYVFGVVFSGSVRNSSTSAGRMTDTS